MFTMMVLKAWPNTLMMLPDSSSLSTHSDCSQTQDSLSVANIMDFAMGHLRYLFPEGVFVSWKKEAIQQMG